MLVSKAELAREEFDFVPSRPRGGRGPTVALGFGQADVTGAAEGLARTLGTDVYGARLLLRRQVPVLFSFAAVEEAAALVRRLADEGVRSFAFDLADLDAVPAARPMERVELGAAAEVTLCDLEGEIRVARVVLAVMAPLKRVHARVRQRVSYHEAPNEIDAERVVEQERETRLESRWVADLHLDDGSVARLLEGASACSLFRGAASTTARAFHAFKQGLAAGGVTVDDGYAEFSERAAAAHEQRHGAPVAVRQEIATGHVGDGTVSLFVATDDRTALFDVYSALTRVLRERDRSRA